jgi:hypothetical protein
LLVGNHYLLSGTKPEISLKYFGGFLFLENKLDTYNFPVMVGDFNAAGFYWRHGICL